MTAALPRLRPLATSPAALIDAAIDGDEYAWSVLCDRHADEVRGVALARLRDPHAADDVVQEAFLRAWTRLHQLDDPARFGAWVKTIAARVAIDQLRSQRPTSALDAAPEQVIDLTPLEDHVVEREAAAVLHSHLAELRDADRTALWQRDALGTPVAELADHLGMTAGSVRVLLTRARAKVREGYSGLVAPLALLPGRLRGRLAGLGEALPVAIAAPAIVVAAVAGVGSFDRAAPVIDDSPSAIAAAPAPSDLRVSSPATLPPPNVTAVPTWTSSAGTTPTGAPPAARASTAEATADPTRPSVAGTGVTVGSASAGFDDAPPPDEESDVSSDAPAGPLSGVDVYVNETDEGGDGGDAGTRSDAGETSNEQKDASDGAGTQQQSGGTLADDGQCVFCVESPGNATDANTGRDG